MSTVFRATDQILGRTVAVKVLLPALADQDPTYLLRFEREARAAAGLASSAVVTVYDTGADAGGHYIVMEFIAGKSLDEMLCDGRPLDVSEALRIAERVADALATAHAAGILHRDIKPANVMVDDYRAVKVLDFGIARRLDGTAITQVASVIGTAAYMAPERALGQPGDARADIYSLGCLLYAMLTGHPPFQGEISASVLHQQINVEPRPPSEHRSGLSPSIDGLVLAMLAKSPEARPAAAVEVRDRLRRLAAAAPAAGTAATTPMTAARAPFAAGSRPGRPRGGRLADHRRRAVLMALVMGAVALIAFALLSGGGSPSSSANHSRHAPTTPQPIPTQPKTKPKSKPKPKAGATAVPHGHGGTPPGHGGGSPGQGGGDGGD
jgi:serine/threonine-protein kinase